jgi:iron complex transport system ATP-binding protein
LAIIEINDLCFQYEQDVSGIPFRLSVEKWEVEKGKFYSIIGPNGCGKSTLLKLIAGINKPNSGSIKIDGKFIHEIKRSDYSKLISYVPQSASSVFPFSVYEIVMMGRTPYLNFMGFEKETDKEIVNESLELMELSNIRNKGINEISGGELQRVFIARALAQKSGIVLLDEPNSHLDLQHQVAVFNLLEKLCDEKGFTVIAVSHDLNMVGIYSHEVIFMKNGKIEIQGNKKEIFTKENIMKIFQVESEVRYSGINGRANIFINPQS